MGMLKEFKEFAVKGNVMDMAVGIIVGVAFGKIVSSFVGDIVMPPIGVMMGGVNFTDLAFVLQEAVGETAAVAINYGKFVQTIIDFVIVAGAVFVAVKTINSMKKVEEAPEEPEAEPEPSKEEVLLSEIRDLLKARN
nr:large-conductance mechanosensitive channel protein MscL [Neptunomonas japonica]